MSDEGLRDLERAWRASHDPHDEARLLAERLRAGLLVRARLELAAYLGHGPARIALGEAAPAGRRVPWLAWVAAIDDEGRRTLVRGLVDGVASERDLRAEAQLDAALDGLLEWLSCPCPTHAASLRVLRDALHVDPPLPEALASAALKRTVGALCLRDAILLVLTPGRDAAEGALRRVLDLARAKDPPLRTAGVIAPLLAWALGPEHGLVPPTEDEQPAAYLRSRLARGELSRERVALAAYADDPEARWALGDGAPHVPAELDAWIAGLADFDPSLRVRVVAAIAGHTLMNQLNRAWLGAPVTPRAYTVRAGIVTVARQACAALRRFSEDPQPTAPKAPRRATDPSEARAGGVGAEGVIATHAERLADPQLDRAAPDDRAQRGVAAIRAALDCALGGTDVDAALAAVRAALPREDHGEALLVARGVVAAWALGG